MGQTCRRLYKLVIDNNKRTGAFEQMQKYSMNPVFNQVYNSDNRKEMGSANNRKEKKEKSIKAIR